MTESFSPAAVQSATLASTDTSVDRHPHVKYININTTHFNLPRLLNVNVFKFIRFLYFICNLIKCVYININTSIYLS